jgi:hypothetical protein
MAQVQLPCHKVVAPLNAWALKLEGIGYNGLPATVPATINKALLDTGSTLTKIPEPVYDNILG